MAASPWASRWAARVWAAGRSASGARTIQSAWFVVARSEVGGSGTDLGREEGLGEDGEVAVIRLGVPGEASPGESAAEEDGSRARGVEEDGAGSGVEAGAARLGGLALEDAGRGGERPRVLEGEAVEVDEGRGGAGVAGVLEAERVRPVAEKRGGHVGHEGGGPHAVEAEVPDEGSVDEGEDVVVGLDEGVAATLEVDAQPRGLGDESGGRGR